MNRKFLNALFAVAVAIAGTMVFASCGNDEPDAPKGEKVVKEAAFTTSLCVNKAMLDTYDIIGTSADGKDLKLTFSNTPVDITLPTSANNQTVAMYLMSVEAKGSTLPLTSAFDVKFTLKDGYTLPEKSDMAYAIYATGTITYSDGSVLYCSNNDFGRFVSGLQSSEIDNFTANLNKTCGHISSTLDETGIKISRKAPEK